MSDICNSIDVLYVIVTEINDLITSTLVPSLSSMIILKSNKKNENDENNNSKDSISIITTSYRFLTETKFLLNPNNIINNELSLTIRKVWSHMLISSSKSYSNWYWILFTSKLIINGINSNIPIPLLVRCYSLMLSSSLKILNEDRNIRLIIDWSDYDNIKCLIKSNLRITSCIFTSLSSNALDDIATSVLGSFLSSLNNHTDILTPSIIYKHCIGYSVENIISLENKLVIDIPLPLEFPDGIGISNATVAIFECSLEISMIYGEDNVQIESINSNDSLKEIEFEVLEKWANIFSNSKVQIVMCQRRIHPYLQRLLRNRGIISLPRLSMHYIGSMQKFTGAKVLGTLPSNSQENIPSHYLGYIGNLQKSTIFGRLFLLASSISQEFENSNENETIQLSSALNDLSFINGVVLRRQRISTILIAGPTNYVCDEIQDSLEIVISNLSAMLKESYVLPGGGCWQAYLVQKLQLDSISQNNDKIITRNSMKNAIKVYINTLESCAILMGTDLYNVNEYKSNMQNLLFVIPSISSNDNINYFRSPSGLYTKALKNDENYKILTTNMIDSYQCSLKSMELAVEIAITLLQINSIAIAQPIENNLYD